MIAKPPVSPLNLPQLETLLQQRLQEKLLEISPLQVNCFLKKDTLLMAVQHPMPALAHPKRAFRVMQEVFREENLQWRYRGLMCLKVQGRDRPYAFAPYTAEPPAKDVAERVKANTPEGIKEREAVFPPPDPDPDWEEEGDPDVVEINNEAVPVPNLDRDRPSVDIEEEDTFEDGAEPWVQQGYVETPQPSPQLEKIWIAAIASGAVLAMAAFLATLYTLTRPCVIGACERIEVAQELANNALQTLQDPPSGRAILQAQQQLQQAIAFLDSIPRWSRKGEEAENLLAAYQGSEAGLKDLISALKTAARAAEATQNPPLSVSQWQTAQQTWAEAIAQLEAIPPTSEFYRFARKKIGEYRENLAIVEQRLAAERKAAESLAAAQEAVKIAEVRQGIAQSLEDLRLAYATWQTAEDRFEAVPPGTTAYDRAQTELAAIMPKLQESEDRKNHELFASEAYNEATRSAQRARAAQRRNRWTEAVSEWQNAVNQIKQVPKDAFNFCKAQPLIEEYEDALARAESSLQEGIQVRQARLDLEGVCNGEIVFCIYSITEDVISVRLTPSYIQQVRDTAIAARAQNNIEAQAEVMDHISALEQALEQVSDNAGIPLEIYTTDNVLVKTHKPR